MDERAPRSAHQQQPQSGWPHYGDRPHPGGGRGLSGPSEGGRGPGYGGRRRAPSVYRPDFVHRGGLDVFHGLDNEQGTMNADKGKAPIRSAPRRSDTVGSRTHYASVLAFGCQISVTVTSEAVSVEEWISRQEGCLFGLDTEWKPSFVRGKKNKVALLQLCADKRCLIVQMLFLDAMPLALVELLANPLKLIAGVDIRADARRLQQDYGLECEGLVELTTLAAQHLDGEELKHAGLKCLVQEVLGLDLSKPRRITMSNWEKQNLDRRQTEYACMDAWASFAIAQKLMNLS